MPKGVPRRVTEQTAQPYTKTPLTSLRTIVYRNSVINKPRDRVARQNSNASVPLTAQRYERNTNPPFRDPNDKTITSSALLPRFQRSGIKINFKTEKSGRKPGRPVLTFLF